MSRLLYEYVRRWCVQAIVVFRSMGKHVRALAVIKGTTSI